MSFDRASSAGMGKRIYKWFFWFIAILKQIVFLQEH